MGKKNNSRKQRGLYYSLDSTLLGVRLGSVTSITACIGLCLMMEGNQEFSRTGSCNRERDWRMPLRIMRTILHNEGHVDPLNVSEWGSIAVSVYNHYVWSSLSFAVSLRSLSPTQLVCLMKETLFWLVSTVHFSSYARMYFLIDRKVCNGASHNVLFQM